MKIALDPYMLRRRVPLLELPRVVADLGYQYIEMSPRDDFLPFFLHPRIDGTPGWPAFKRELAAAEVRVSSVLPLYRWSRAGEEDARQAAVRSTGGGPSRSPWISGEVDVMNSEFNGGPDRPDEGARRNSGARSGNCCRCSSGRVCGLVLEPHPDDFVEDGIAGVDLVRDGINSPLVSFLYCAPHTFHQGGDLAAVIKHAGPLLTQVHIADSFDHRGGRPGCGTS